jgi:hypothetical protein
MYSERIVFRATPPSGALRATFLWFGLRFGLSFAFAVAACAQVAGLQIRVVEGEGTVHPQGSRSPHPLTVAITDETGKPVADAAVSFHVPEAGPGGSFSNGLHTAVATTNASGRATVRSLHVNRLAGRFQIRILASKEQARAGTVSFQFVGTDSRGAAKGRGKWAVVVALAGGGAVAGLVASRRPESGAVVTAPQAPQPPALSIGAPSISVGKP